MSSNFPTAAPASKTNFDSSTAVGSALQNAQGEDINAVAAKVGHGTDDNTPAANKILRGTAAGKSEWDFDIKDEDEMTSDSATAVPTQQSTKAYVDTHAADTTTHGATGAVVGTTNSQTLTNKILTTPTLTTPKVDVINEETGAAGVTIDSLLIKDGNAAKATALSTTAKARAYLGSNQLDLVSGAPTQVLLDTENYDIGGNFASSKFVAPVTGYYLIIGQVTFLAATVVLDKRYAAYIYVGGTAISNTFVHASYVSAVTPRVSDIWLLTAGDEVTLRARSDAGVNTTDIQGLTSLTYMTVHLLSV